MSYLKDREIWLSSVPTGNPPAGYVWVFIQNGVFVVRDSSGVDKIMATTTGTVTNATSASYVEYNNVANKPALISGSSQVSFNGITDKPALVSSSAQIVGYNVFATTGSNQFNGSQAITGSLTVTGQVVAQTLNVQQVTSSIVYSSGSNIFGNSLGNTQQFTGSLQVSGSSHYVLGNVGISTITPQTPLQILRDTTGNGTSIEESNMAFTVLSAAGQSKISIGASNAGNYGYVQVMQDATSWTNRNLVLQPRGGNVGIGTYTPLDTFTDRTVLTINGTTNGAFLNFGSSGTLNAFIQSNTSGFQIGSQANIPVEIRVNGSNALVLAASGGAATFSSTVTAKVSLKIENTGAASFLYFNNTSAPASNYIALGSAANEMYFQVNGADRIVIKDNGNVGIGTTTINSERLTVAQTTGNASALLVYTSGVTTGQSYGATIIGGTNASDASFRVFNQGAGTNYFHVRGDGNVGIGTASPIEKFHVIGSGIFDNSSFGTAQIRLKGTGTSTGFDLQNSSNDGYLWNRDGGNIYFGTSNTERMRIQGTSVIIVGSLSKGSGSFKIDHPLSSKKDTHYLVHSFIEGPQADNIYRGKIQLVNGKATVNLDQAARMTEGTFILLNGNTQCFTSNESGWTAVKGIVAENILTIEAQDPECTDIISWLVIGERIDQHMLDTEWTDENGKVITEPLKQ